MPGAAAPTTKAGFTAAIRRCTRFAHLRQTHALLLTTGFSIKNSLLTRLLLLSLAVPDGAAYARSLFNAMHRPRPFLWNTLIRFYSSSTRNNPSEALALYFSMHRLSIRPDEFTFPFVFRACAQLLNARGGAAAHALFIKHRLVSNSSSTIALTELAAMYARFIDEDEFSPDRVFNEIRGEDRDVIAWNAIISAHAQTGRADKALAFFRSMELDDSSNVEPDAFTLSSVLSACAQLGCLQIGKRIHCRIMNDEMLPNVVLENALIDMYVKCGCVTEACKVFDELRHRKNLVSWSAMIGGYAINGYSNAALEFYSRMMNDGVGPNNVTMLAVLLACSHAGLVSQGKEHFLSIAAPDLEHYTAMVDMLARSGQLEEAHQLIRGMPMEPDAAVWGALLGACTKFRNLELGQVAADELLRLASNIPSYGVLLSNIYALSGRWDCVEQVRERMKASNVKKLAAYSSVEMDSEVHVFYEGSLSHSKEIYKKLEELTSLATGVGYLPETSVALHDLETEEKEAALQTHSERLALAFSLIKSGSREPLRVIKNLRICSDCHSFCKHISLALAREIVMRDKSRFHHFRDGSCSCRDFW